MNRPPEGLVKKLGLAIHSAAASDEKVGQIFDEITEAVGCEMMIQLEIYVGPVVNIPIVQNRRQKIRRKTANPDAIAEEDKKFLRRLRISTE